MHAEILSLVLGNLGLTKLGIMMKKVINYFDETKPLTHRNLANSILDNNLTVEKKKIYPQIVRPNVRKLDTINSKIVNECYNEWTLTHCEEDILFLNKKYEL
mgnify:CR=1 FL=1